MKSKDKVLSLSKCSCYLMTRVNWPLFLCLFSHRASLSPSTNTKNLIITTNHVNLSPLNPPLPLSHSSPPEPSAPAPPALKLRHFWPRVVLTFQWPYLHYVEVFIHGFPKYVPHCHRHVNGQGKGMLTISCPLATGSPNDHSFAPNDQSFVPSDHSLVPSDQSLVPSDQSFVPTIL